MRAEGAGFVSHPLGVVHGNILIAFKALKMLMPTNISRFASGVQNRMWVGSDTIGISWLPPHCLKTHEPLHLFFPDKSDERSLFNTGGRLQPGPHKPVAHPDGSQCVGLVGHMI
jgi:hypothetical protein